MGYKTTYKNLTVTSLDVERHDKTCGYWYVVQHSGATPHAAFTKKENLLRWLEERGLTLANPLPAERGIFSITIVIGSYRDELHLSVDEVMENVGAHTRKLANGQYTLAIITNDDDGIRTVHYPNCKDCPIYDYEESRATYG